MALSDDEHLERSAVVANCRMNRERTLTGSNGYGREIGFEPLDFLRSRVERHGSASWLDLCCGSGRALIEASRIAAAQGLPITIVGVDLVGMFAPFDRDNGGLKLIEASLSRWRPDDPPSFDLITCVHGLHYIGDKLGLIARAVSWLADEDGRFVASLDPDNLRLGPAGSPRRIPVATFQTAGFTVARRARRILRDGRIADLEFPFTYLGADDQAGPNSTGQPAVNSHYGGRKRPPHRIADRLPAPDR